MDLDDVEFDRFSRLLCSFAVVFHQEAQRIVLQALEQRGYVARSIWYGGAAPTTPWHKIRTKEHAEAARYVLAQQPTWKGLHSDLWQQLRTMEARVRQLAQEKHAVAAEAKELERQLRRVPTPLELETVVRTQLQELEQELRAAAARALTSAVEWREEAQKYFKDAEAAYTEVITKRTEGHDLADQRLAQMRELEATIRARDNELRALKAGLKELKHTPSPRPEDPPKGDKKMVSGSRYALAQSQLALKAKEIEVDTLRAGIAALAPAALPESVPAPPALPTAAVALPTHLQRVSPSAPSSPSEGFPARVGLAASASQASSGGKAPLVKEPSSKKSRS